MGFGRGDDVRSEPGRDLWKGFVVVAYDETHLVVSLDVLFECGFGDCGSPKGMDPLVRPETARKAGAEDDRSDQGLATQRLLLLAVCDSPLLGLSGRP
jgi:hypothetical protein